MEGGLIEEDAVCKRPEGRHSRHLTCRKVWENERKHPMMP